MMRFTLFVANRYPLGQTGREAQYLQPSHHTNLLRLHLLGKIKHLNLKIY